MIPVRDGCVWHGAGVLNMGGMAREMLLVAETDSYTTIRNENMNFAWRVVSEYTVRMLSGWVVLTSHYIRRLYKRRKRQIFRFK
jgi:hypothetical protein